MDRLTVAIDVGALHGHRTGVGTAVHHMVHHLEHRPDVELMPYLVSFRARPIPPQRRLPIPAALAVRAWARSDHPRADRWLAGAHVVHGPNYVVPPSGLPTVVSVYDCWSLAHPDLASPAVRRAGAVLRRAVARGAWVHVSSHATAALASDLLGTDRIAVVHLGPPDPPPATTPPATVPPAVPATLAGRPYVVCVGTTRTAQGRHRTGACLRCHRAPVHRPASRDRRRSRRRQLQGRAGTRRTPATHPLARPGHRCGRRADESRAPRRRGRAGLPVARRGVRLPHPRGPAGRHPRGRPSRRIDPRGGRRRRRSWPADGIDDARRRARQVVDDDGGEPSSSPPARHNLSRFSWSRTADGLVNLYRVPPRPSRRPGDTTHRTTRAPSPVAGGVGAARFLRGVCRWSTPGRHRRRQHRRRHRAARPPRLPRPRHHHLHPRGRDRSRAGLGARRRDLERDGGPRALRRRAPDGSAAAPPGSTSATATSRRTSTGPPDSPRAPPSPGHRRDRRRVGAPAAPSCR
jgi:hypothetical protein